MHPEGKKGCPDMSFFHKLRPAGRRSQDQLRQHLYRFRHMDLSFVLPRLMSGVNVLLQVFRCRCDDHAQVIAAFGKLIRFSLKQFLRTVFRILRIPRRISRDHPAEILMTISLISRDHLLLHQFDAFRRAGNEEGTAVVQMFKVIVQLLINLRLRVLLLLFFLFLRLFNGKKEHIGVLLKARFCLVSRTEVDRIRVLADPRDDYPSHFLFTHIHLLFRIIRRNSALFSYRHFCFC